MATLAFNPLNSDVTVSTTVYRSKRYVALKEGEETQARSVGLKVEGDPDFRAPWMCFGCRIERT